MTRRFIITGGPGTGKTTLIDALSQAGWATHSEVSRRVIREQNLMGGDCVPWKNLRGFAEACQPRMLKEATRPEADCVCFLDRGLPDLTAYLCRRGLPPLPDPISPRSLYEMMVFVAPPWRGIFINDPERPETFTDCQELHYHLLDVYAGQGFEPLILPRVSTQERVAFVLQAVGLSSLETAGISR